LGARNLLDLKPDEMRDLLVAVQKAAIAQKKGLGATGFRVQSNNGLSSSQTVYHPHFHVIPSYGGKAPGTPAPRRKLSDAEYKDVAAKLRAAWPR
jgi:histidine triad (HIT) family protein